MKLRNTLKTNYELISFRTVRISGAIAFKSTFVTFRDLELEVEALLSFMLQ